MDLDILIKSLSDKEKKYMLSNLTTYFKEQIKENNEVIFIDWFKENKSELTSRTRNALFNFINNCDNYGGYGFSKTLLDNLLIKDIRFLQLMSLGMSGYKEIKKLCDNKNIDIIIPKQYYWGNSN